MAWQEGSWVDEELTDLAINTQNVAAEAIASGQEAMAAASNLLEVSASIGESAQDTSAAIEEVAQQVEEQAVETQAEIATLTVETEERLSERINGLRSEVQQFMDVSSEITASAIEELSERVEEIALVLAQKIEVLEELLRQEESTPEPLIIAPPPETPQQTMEERGWLSRIFLQPR